jgi:hypothetical protein
MRIIVGSFVTAAATGASIAEGTAWQIGHQHHQFALHLEAARIASKILHLVKRALASVGG